MEKKHMDFMEMVETTGKESLTAFSHSAPTQLEINIVENSCRSAYIARIVITDNGHNGSMYNMQVYVNDPAYNVVDLLAGKYYDNLCAYDDCCYWTGFRSVEMGFELA